MSSLLGTWDVEMKTPIGTLSAVYVFTDTGGVLAGTATSKSETVPLDAIAWDGTRATWRQSVTRPMRLHLDFDVTVDGRSLTGHSRAGRLPRTTVNGTRRTEGPAPSA
ncbi:hypothetical protein [Actinoplanes couchii]|uniref:Uncharacterized protein n=1 Tax=Actinoplanes couchii TaxID=403638 RepID=A0ABQ3XTI5_9ACTN|nr:hypothetical protein [Actinoplanes couchii]MDR6318921.1 hypothetical protein [Actinoplanes couchii]GID61829.1 hypothetical protein Aco03nite_102330 [Actinoplanes couchii]